MTIWSSKLHVGRESAVARVNQARSARSGFYSVIVWNHRVNGFSGKCMKNKSATGASCRKPKTPFCHKGIFSLLRRIRSELRYPDKRRSVFTTQSRIRLTAKIHARRSAVVTTNNDEDEDEDTSHNTAGGGRKRGLSGNRSVCPPATRSTLSPFALSTIVKNQDRSDHPPQALRVIIVVWYTRLRNVG
ncbi:hypothetical protein ALC57_06012 [Trachymyrmex cornetzi]|uniref:Uncharacterized protein n=1 Tax=Trachymyrmex cornetzi TaxID=471704 RepID=A0A151J9B8_9HYME|nr:hypothetical protein ALC57_06012 [Trachymyrmex cornetzi]